MPDLIIKDTAYAISGILLDKDGTVLDFVSMWGRWSEWLLDGFVRRLESQTGQTLPSGLVPLLLGTKHDEHGRIADYDRNGPLAMGTMQELLGVLAWHGYRAGMSWAEAKELVQMCKDEADAELERTRPVLPLPGVVRLLESCVSCGIPLGLVTADETESAEKHLEWMGIRHYFGVVIGTDRVERGKPFPDMMELACAQLGIACEGTAVIGDTNGDMRMGRAAGAAVTVGIAGPAGPAGSVGADDPGSLLPDAGRIIFSYDELQIRGNNDEG